MGLTQKILVVDDEEDICNLVCGILDDEGYETCVASNSQEAYDLISDAPPALVIQDIWLQGSEDDGLEILEAVKEEHPYMPFIMISGHGTIETAVSAIQHGAYDFIEKPFKSDRLILMIKRALESSDLRKENAYLKQSAQGYDEFVGTSQTSEQLKSMLERVAVSNSRVLITGEAGVGKDVAAWFIHRHSERRDHVFQVVNCATLDPDRLEAELFGVEGQGAGVLEGANGGTLFLDQVVDMPLETQGKVLRVLQEQRFKRVGGQNEIAVDIRIIASSNKDLEQAIAEGKLREDLYYRLNVVPVEVPPLRKRADDIQALVSYFAAQVRGVPIEKPCAFSADFYDALFQYAWPGNVRQLRNVVEWVLIMCGDNGGKPITAAQLPPDILGQCTVPSASVSSLGDDSAYITMPLRAARESFERDYLAMQLDRFDGNISQTAKFVGMERSALHRKLKLLGISENEKDNTATKRKSA